MTYGAQAWDNPDAFVGRATLNAYEPYQVLTGSQYSSIAPQSAAVVRWNQPTPVAVKNVMFQASLNAIAASATSANSSGSEGYTYGLSAFLYSRQDYSANSTNLAPVVSGLFRLNASLSYSSGSQTMGVSWVTDTTGGVANLTTTSGDAGWSVYLSGPKMLSMPFVTALPAGEYWMALQHSSTTATSNSNVTLMSVSQLQLVAQQASVSAGVLGASVTANSAFMDVGLIATTPVFSTTMPFSSVVAGGRPIWFALSNA